VEITIAILEVKKFSDPDGSRQKQYNSIIILISEKTRLSKPQDDQITLILAKMNDCCIYYGISFPSYFYLLDNE
jgi:hypothetical protein